MLLKPSVLIQEAKETLARIELSNKKILNQINEMIKVEQLRKDNKRSHSIKGKTP